MREEKAIMYVLLLIKSSHRYFPAVNWYFDNGISPYIPSTLDCKWYHLIKRENKTSSDKFPYFKSKLKKKNQAETTQVSLVLENIFY